MKKSMLFILLLCTSYQTVCAQAETSFSCSLSSDSILFGNYFEVRYTLEQAEAIQFHAPNFEGFEIVSGPNTSNSISMINGASTRSATYSYQLRPMEIGVYELPSASIETTEGLLSTEPIALRVVPNPEGIIQTPKREEQWESIFGENPFEHRFFRNPFDSIAPARPKQPTKRKRKVTKI